MPRTKLWTAAMHLRLRHEDMERMEALAAKMSLTKSDIARQAIRLGLDALEAATRKRRRIDVMYGVLAEEEGAEVDEP